MFYYIFISEITEISEISEISEFREISESSEIREISEKSERKYSSQIFAWRGRREWSKRDLGRHGGANTERTDRCQKYCGQVS